MYLTSREKTILKELMITETPVTVEYLVGLLKVSKRTVYRELTNLTDSLTVAGLQLQKVGRGQFRLSASPEIKTKLLLELEADSLPELAVSTRQNAILLQLLTSTEPISMQFFLDEYLISNNTFFADLKQIEARLASLPLTIERKRGYELNGSEKHQRLLAANILGSEINEYQFFHIADLNEQENFFLRFIDRETILYAQQTIQQIIVPRFADLSDRKLEFLVLMLTLAIERVTHGHHLQEENYAGKYNKEWLALAKEIFTDVAKQTNQLYPVSEIVFFAHLISDFVNSFDNDFLAENFDTSMAYQVKKMIELISAETDIAFFEDANLYKMLLAHLSATLSRGVLDATSLSNPILERITAQYDDIAKAIKLALARVFPRQCFSAEEIAYMVLHFANSLEQSPQVIAVDIAGISPSGLASTRMLEMQLRKHFPFINRIVFFRIADLGKINLEAEFDLTVSTAILPGYSGKYLLISPLLLEDEVKQLKKFFQTIDHNHRKLARQTLTKESNADNYQKIMGFVAAIDQLLAYFFIQPLHNNSDIQQIINEAVNQIPSEITREPLVVSQKLLNRYRQAPIGIPDTQFALFHAASVAVSQPWFGIFDLTTPIEILGMDKKPMLLSRMLIMLAPDPVSADSGKILGTISGAIIMNDLNTEIFNSGNEAIIYQLLSSLLITEIPK